MADETAPRDERDQDYAPAPLPPLDAERARFRANWERASEDQKHALWKFAQTWEPTFLQAPPGFGKTWFIGQLLYPFVASGEILRFMYTPYLLGWDNTERFGRSAPGDRIWEYLGYNIHDFAHVLILATTTGVAATPYSSIRIARTIHGMFGIDFPRNEYSDDPEADHRPFRKDALDRCADDVKTYLALANQGEPSPVEIGDRRAEHPRFSATEPARGYDCAARRLFLGQILLVDETSMSAGFLLKTVDDLARAVRHYLDRRNGSRPFGGLRPILVGDELQLGPVGKGRTPPLRYFEHPFIKDIKWMRLSLTTNHRQKEDPLFAQILERVRTLQHHEDLPEAMINALVTPERLCTTEKSLALLRQARAEGQRPPMYVAGDNASVTAFNKRADEDVNPREFPEVVLRPVYFLEARVPSILPNGYASFYATKFVDDVFLPTDSDAAAVLRSEAFEDHGGYDAALEGALMVDENVAQGDGGGAAAASSSVVGGADPPEVLHCRLTPYDRVMILRKLMHIDKLRTLRFKTKSPVMCLVNRLDQGLGNGSALIVEGAVRAIPRAEIAAAEGTTLIGNGDALNEKPSAVADEIPRLDPRRDIRILSTIRRSVITGERPGDGLLAEDYRPNHDPISKKPVASRLLTDWKHAAPIDLALKRSYRQSLSLSSREAASLVTTDTEEVCMVDGVQQRHLLRTFPHPGDLRKGRGARAREVKLYLTAVYQPLQLDYARTVHKTQSLTFRNGVIINGRNFFQPGHMCVALSRATTRSKVWFDLYDNAATPQTIKNMFQRRGKTFASPAALKFVSTFPKHDPSPRAAALRREHTAYLDRLSLGYADEGAFWRWHHYFRRHQGPSTQPPSSSLPATGTPAPSSPPRRAPIAGGKRARDAPVRDRTGHGVAPPAESSARSSSSASKPFHALHPSIRVACASRAANEAETETLGDQSVFVPETDEDDDGDTAVETQSGARILPSLDFLFAAPKPDAGSGSGAQTSRQHVDENDGELD